MKVKLAIDFGSANMKMVGIIDNKIQKRIIQSKASTDGTSKLSDKNTIEFDGRKVYFGAGNPLVKKNKIDRDFIIESVFLATNSIYGKIDKNFEIELAIGLPLSQYTSNEKDVYLKELKATYLNKSLTGIVDDNNIEIKITYINIYAEGYSGFLNIMRKVNTKKPLLVIDVGYKTTDIVGIKYDTLTKGLIVDNYCSISKGMLEIINDITAMFNDKTGADYSPETIEYHIINGIDIQYTNQDGLVNENINKWLKYGDIVLSYILNEMEIKSFPDWKSRNLYFLGGGVKIISNILNEMQNKDKRKSVIIEEVNHETDEYEDINNKEEDMLMFANSIGYLMQLVNDTIDIIESEDVFVSDKKLEKGKKSVALTNE